MEKFYCELTFFLSGIPKGLLCLLCPQNGYVPNVRHYQTQISLKAQYTRQLRNTDITNLFSCFLGRFGKHPSTGAKVVSMGQNKKVNNFIAIKSQFNPISTTIPPFNHKGEVLYDTNPFTTIPQLIHQNSTTIPLPFNHSLIKSSYPKQFKSCMIGSEFTPV